jgi:hypothetical protein
VNYSISTIRTAKGIKSAVLVIIAIILPMILTSCGRSAGTERVALPPTPVLSIRSTWAVVKSPLLRVREQPSNQATVLSHIRMGAVMEVLTKSDKEDSVEDESSFWYRIDYQGLKGWVFGTYIEIFDSRSKADRFSATLQ